MGVTGLSCSNRGIKFETQGVMRSPWLLLVFQMQVGGQRGEGALSLGPHPSPPITCPLQGHSCTRKLASDLELLIVKNHLEQLVAGGTL